MIPNPLSQDGIHPGLPTFARRTEIRQYILIVVPLLPRMTAPCFCLWIVTQPANIDFKEWIGPLWLMAKATG